MEMEITCDCGQVIRLGPGPVPPALACPACGRVVTASPPGAAGVASPYAQPPAGGAGARPASGKAMASLVFGLCSLIPGLGLICAPIAVGLGIAVLVKKLGGKGFGIAGIATGAAGLLVVQTFTAILVYGAISVARMARSTVASMQAAAMVQATQTTLSDDEIDESLDPNALGAGMSAAEPSLAALRRLYASRDDEPDSLFRCVRGLHRHLRSHAKGDFESLEDRVLLQKAEIELRRRLKEKYDRAVDLEQQLRWSEAADAFDEVILMIDDPNHPIHVNAAGHAEACRNLE